MDHCQLRAIMHSVSSVCLLAGVLLAGCATPQPVTVEEQVGDKALQWADALMAGDYDGALSFMTPSYQNSPRSERFRGDFSGAGYWQAAEIKWVKCDDEDAAEAGVEEGADHASTASADAAISGSADAPDNAHGCVVTVWDDCGQAFPGPISTSGTASTSSDRCEVRLMLSVMKPPEMSYPMPIPYEMTWLNIRRALARVSPVSGISLRLFLVDGSMYYRGESGVNVDRIRCTREFGRYSQAKKCRLTDAESEESQKNHKKMGIMSAH